jgi:hypothetical protein
MSKRRQPSTAGGNVQKNPSSKAEAILTRGAYMEYVSTAKWRERRWGLFSTFPDSKNVVFLYDPLTKKSKAQNPCPYSH